VIASALPAADYLALLAAVAPVFLIIGAGFAIRLAGWLNAEADASLMQVIVKLLYPCLIFDTIVGNAAMENARNVLLAPVVGFVTVAMGYVFSLGAARMFALGDDRTRRTFAFTTGMYNYGYVPLPLVQKLFGGATTAVLFLHNVGVEIALWTVGISIISAAKPSAQSRWRHLCNAPVLAIVIGVLFHFAGARRWLPEIGLTAIHSVGVTAIPLGLLLTVATFADETRGLQMHTRGRITVTSIVLRLGIFPVLMLLLARWLPAPVELRRIIVIQSAMPCAVMPVILAKHYGGDSATAMHVVIVTSLLALVTIPLWLQLGFRWVLWP
jgi:predicted permease